MINKLLGNKNINTPAFIIDEARLEQSAKNVREACDKAGCKALYSLKPLTYKFVLARIGPYVDGFSVSSANESNQVREILTKEQTVHFTTPGLREREIEGLSDNITYVAFNSLTQYGRYGDRFPGSAFKGLRVNPELSFADDERYDPCTEYSKLGILLDELSKFFKQRGGSLAGISGLLVHSNCESTNFSELWKTAEKIIGKIPEILETIKWINLGGGYLFDEPVNLEYFYKTVDILKNRFNLEVLIEPGASFVRAAGVIVTEVIDLFRRKDGEIAVVDTTVNHMPEVFEYQFEPDIAGYDEDGEYEYIIAGSSCLSGDILGEYTFREPLHIGDRLVIENSGAYSTVKMHTFNGIPLPDIYLYNRNNELQKVRSYANKDYDALFGV